MKRLLHKSEAESYWKACVYYTFCKSIIKDITESQLFNQYAKQNQTKLLEQNDAGFKRYTKIHKTTSGQMLCKSTRRPRPNQVV